VPTHVHVGGISFLILGMEILLWLALFRVIEMYTSQNVVGKSLAFIH
jgi:hypothetical protein